MRQNQASTFFTTQQRIKMHHDTMVTKWPDQTTEPNVAIGAMQDPIRVGACFNATVLPEAVAGV